MARQLDRPNILLLYTDQQRLDTLRCAGRPWAITPNLDRLAAEGAFFEHAYVQAPVCAPSRMSFLTGRYCSSLGVGWNGINFPEADATPVNQILKPYGYHTAQIGKLHFTSTIARVHMNPHPTYGFDTFILSDQPGSYEDAYIRWVRSIDPSQVDKVRLPVHPVPQRYGHVTHKPYREECEPVLFEGDEDLTHSAFVAGETCRYLESRRPGEPFFAIAGFFAPHMPLVAVERFVRMFDPADMPLPVMSEDERRQMIATGAAYAGWSDAQWQLARVYYAALVAEVDASVGRILQTLDRLGMTERTLVLFTSDHGEFIGDHGRIQKGMPGHDCITRVPLLARLPGRIAAGRRISALVEHVDVVPTMLDYAGIQSPQFVQGRSLRPLLEGSASEHRQDVLTESFLAGQSQATIRTRTHRYNTGANSGEILYDLEADPHELTNRAADPAAREVLSDLRHRLARRLLTAHQRFRPRVADW
jgi:arylsulfatase